MAEVPQKAALRRARRKVTHADQARERAGAELAETIRAAAAAGLTWTEIMTTAGVARRTVERALKNRPDLAEPNPNGVTSPPRR